MSNTDLLKHFFDAANRRDFGTVMDLYADDVDLVVPGPWINGGVHRGKEAVGRFFGDWYRTFDGGPHFEIQETREAGEAVALSANATARGGISGVELETTYFYVYRVREGKVVHVQFYDDWDEAVAAAAHG
ncbi:MAG TPA: nuclear transport factor 2 family protein [Thermoleophilaceae bacterium]|nr:nuclear transport factor 2 family protein [Thermoleophilaceae bacterium]